MTRRNRADRSISEGKEGRKEDGRVSSGGGRSKARRDHINHPNGTGGSPSTLAPRRTGEPLSPACGGNVGIMMRTLGTTDTLGGL
jgi:hypothetical protein